MTALVLSGGASKGAYEIGVCQAVLDLELKIDMAVGTSIGAMNAYVIAQGGLEAAKDVWLHLRTEDVFDRGGASSGMARFTGIKDLLAARFSEEAVRASDIDFGLCTVRIPDGADIARAAERFRHHAGPLELSDLEDLKPEVLRLWKEDIPEGRMMDYILASCSAVPLTIPYTIDGETYIDGGFSDNLPVSMALERGADLIIAVSLHAVGRVKLRDLIRADMQKKLIYISPSGPTGNMAEFDPENSERIMRMGYADALKTLKRHGFPK